MCQYLTPDGIARDWHMVHLGSRAVGKAGLVMVEASSVSLEGRITPGDSEIWMEEQAGAMLPFVSFVKPQGATPGIQFANVGRKV
jgi:2,4-dienoyl-CoA reductase-like NADH-dependent reductase (Old Yellow Enzyme family)